jgi:hypothetical protein
VSQISVTNPLTGRVEKISALLADRAQMRILHMVTGDANRTATFFDFLNLGFQGLIGGPDCANDPNTLVMQCPAVETWLHGDIQPVMTTTWASIVGPGVEHRGIVDNVWSDHTDVRPTILAALGLRDQYLHDGRVLTEVLSKIDSRSDDETFSELQRVYKQINAPVGRLALATIHATTQAMQSGRPGDDDQYARVNREIQSLGAERDELASQIRSVLENVAFQGGHVDNGQARLVPPAPG